MAFINGYSGTPLHILRGSGTLNLTQYFDTATQIENIELLPYNAGSDVYSYDNIIVNRGSKSITAGSHGSGQKVYNFMMSVNDLINGVKTIVVYVHDTLEEIWLNPGSMTIRNGFDDIRFAVMAKFKQTAPNVTVMADISEMNAFEWTIPNSAYNFLTINANTGRIKITGTLPSSGSFTDCVKVTLKNGSPIYKAGTNATATLLPGTSTGELMLDGTIENDAYKERMNFLFIGDGFTTAETEVFNNYACDIILQMRHDSCTTPWNLVSPKLNFWKYFIPSPGDGGTLNSEYVVADNATPSAMSVVATKSYIEIADHIYSLLRTGKTAAVKAEILETFTRNGFTALSLKLAPTVNALPVPSSGQTYFDSNVLSLTNLLSMVEYPDKADKASAEANLDAARTAKITKWQAINSTYNLNTPTVNTYLHKLIFQLWALMGDRVFMEHADTPWGSFEGPSPNINPGKEKDLGMDTLEQHTYKMLDKNKFNSIISNITYTSSNVPIGQEFYKLDGGIYKPGKDGNNIIILTKTPTNKFFGLTIHGSVEAPNPTDPLIDNMGTRRTSTVHDKVYAAVAVAEHTADKVYKIKPISLMEGGAPKPISFVARGTAVHEISHNWLMDEYSGTKAADPSPSQKFIKEIASTNLDYPRGNLLQTLKWRLPRIKKVGLLSKKLEYNSTTTKYKVEIKISEIALGKGISAFKAPEAVYLRGPKLFGQPPVISVNSVYILNCPKFTIDSISDSNGIRTFILTYSGNIGTTVNVDHYDKKSILFSPRTVGTTDVIQEVIQNEIRAKMIQAGRTFRTGNRNYSTEPQVPALSTDPLSVYIKSLKKPSKLERLVGAYEGGKGYYTNIYHPSGFCLMRSAQQQDEPSRWISEPEQRYNANYFCPVCQYILVANLDPLQFPAIDDLYESHYPE